MRCLALLCRQIYEKARVFPRSACYVDCPACMFDDSIGRRQPEVAAFAKLFGGKEGVEYSAARIFVHTRSRIGYLYQCLVSAR